MKKIKDCFIQIVEIVIIIVLFFIPHVFNFKGLFNQYISETTVSPDNVIYYLVLQKSNIIIGIVLALAAFIWVRKYNKDNNIIINRENVYHAYPVWWYWFSSKILGINKCSLINVPIYNQMVLVINNIFDEFPLDDNIFPLIEQEDINVNLSNYQKNHESKEINLILEDTYIIEFKQLPRNKRNLPTVKISRNNGKDCSRRYSPQFVEKVVNEVRRMGADIRVNIFATTNPKNLYYISKSVFAMADRGNIKHLYVYQQSEKNERYFKDKGKKCY